MLPYDSDRIVDAAENLGDSASYNVFHAWAWGVAVALTLAIYGIWCIGTQSVHFLEGKPAHVVVYREGRAISLGITYLCAGVFLNLHFFWSWRSRYRGCAQIGKAVALIGAAGGLGYFIYSVLIAG